MPQELSSKPPLRPKHVWSIRTKLQIEGRTRDLAMFNVAIDSKLRGSDVVALKVEDVAPNGYALDRATVRQKKTGQPVRFELTEQTRQAIDEYVGSPAGSPVIFYSQVVATGTGPFRPGSTHGLCPTGSRVLASTQAGSVLIRCGEQRQV